MIVPEDVAAALTLRGVPLVAVDTVAEALGGLLQLGADVSAVVAGDPGVYPLLVLANWENGIQTL